MRSLFLLLLALCTLPGTRARAQSSPAAATTADYAAVLAEAFPADGPGGTAIVVKKGEVVYHGAHGMANLELDVAMKPENVFRIGSITKQFTAMAILKLAEDGKLSLDDLVTKFFPNHPNAKNITVRHLLNHTSGIKGDSEMSVWTAEKRRQDFTLTELVKFLQDEPVNAPPGEQWTYSNTGFLILGAIIEKVSGQLYDAYLAEQFFEPLGMDDTQFDYTMKIIPNRVPGYSTGILGLQNTPYLSMTQISSAGSLLSTVSDLSKWYHGLAAGKVVSPASLALALEPTVLNDGTKHDYGFGLISIKEEGNVRFGHNGSVNGFFADSRYFPEDEIFVAVFSNCNCKVATPPMKRLIDLARGKTDPALAGAALTAEQTANFPGRYQIAEGFILTLREKDGRLEAQATGQGAFFLDATIDKDVFTKTAYGIKITFNYDESGQVKSLTLDQNGKRIAPKL